VSIPPLPTTALIDEIPWDAGLFFPTTLAIPSSWHRLMGRADGTMLECPDDSTAVPSSIFRSPRGFELWPTIGLPRPIILRRRIGDSLCGLLFALFGGHITAALLRFRRDIDGRVP
jgi:hypothetical protein